MSFGVLLGLVPVPIPGLGDFTLGLAGGPLVAALLLGWLGCTVRSPAHAPAADLTLRTFGLTSSWRPLAWVLAPVRGDAGQRRIPLPVYRCGHRSGGNADRAASRAVGAPVATDDLLGIVSGVTGNPAILIYANKVQRSDRIDAAYATLFRR